MIEEDSAASGTGQIELWWCAQVEGLLEGAVAVGFLDRDAFCPGEAREGWRGVGNSREADVVEGLVDDGTIGVAVAVIWAGDGRAADDV